MAHLADATPNTPLDKQVLFHICQQLELNPGEFQHSIPSHSRGGQIVGRIWPVFLPHQLAEGLEHVREQGHIGSQVEVVIISERAALGEPPHLLRPFIISWLDVIPCEVATKLVRRW